MNMTEKNGQPSMEEILASIRRIIAEEPASHAHNGELRGKPIMLKGDSALDDAGDFDLPAIFRSSPPPPTERHAPLLGRLSDAIRSATTPASDARGLVNGDEYEHAEVAAEGGFSGLSSLKPTRHDTAPVEPLRPLNPTPAAHEAPASSSGAFATMASSGSKPPEEPRRQMAPFKDTHFLRMAGAPSAEPSPAPTPAPASAAPAAQPPDEPKPLNFGNIIPGQFDRGSLVNGHAAAPQTFVGSYQPTVAPPPSAAPGVTPPPPLPAADHNALVVVPPGVEETGTIEDTTADLLRPMLRQWLADNMPRMVEKALHIEIAESIKSPKKP